VDITFNCDACGQNIVIDEAGAGCIVECPKCGVRVLVPVPSEQAATTSSTLTQCPDCSREVSKRAAACPHCGAPLTGATSPAPTISSDAQKRPNEHSVIMSVFRISMLLLAVLCVLGGFSNPLIWIGAIVFLLLGVLVKRVC
jgi:DNA-directed RNA polymerase subunit RPC12/RpoP